MADLYDYWRNGLQGKFGPVHDGDPQCGFYRWRNKGGHDEPVAIWQQDGAMLALRGTKPVDPVDVWISVCSRPIPEEVYRGVLAGGMWPDEIAPIGSNNPPEGEAETDEVQSAIDAALAELAGGITNQAQADRTAAHRDRLLKLYKAKDAEREEKKRPHLEAGRKIDSDYRSVLTGLEDAGKKLRAAITKWLLQQESEKRAEAPADAPPPKVTAGGISTRAVSMRSRKVAKLVDFTAALLSFADDPDIKELVQKKANAMAKSGIAAPGCVIEEIREAA